MTTKEKRPEVRLNRRHADMARARIRVGYILSRLHKCIAGEIELSQVQLSACKLALDKALPNAPTDMNVSGSISVAWPLAPAAREHG